MMFTNSGIKICENITALVLVSVVSGSLRAANEANGATRTPFAQRLARGDNALVPFSGAFTFTAETTTILLVTENFVG